MVEAGEDPKFIARRMVIFASELKVPSGRGHAAPASLVNLKKLEDRVFMKSSPMHLNDLQWCGPVTPRSTIALQ
jgi:hypothetical protein